MTTDIDRLHRTLLKPGVRASGRTTLRCHELAGCIELGFSTIYCLVDSVWDGQNYLVLMINDVLEEHGLPLLSRDNLDRWFCGDVLIQFITKRANLHGLHGVIVPMGYDD